MFGLQDPGGGGLEILAGTVSKQPCPLPWGWDVFQCMGADGFAAYQFVFKHILLSDSWVREQAGFTSTHKGGRRGRLSTHRVQESRVGCKNKHV